MEKATVDSVMALAKAYGNALGCSATDTRELKGVLRAEVERLAAQAAPPEEVSPEFTDTARAALLWVLWHHQGASSKVGQPIRFALGMGQHDALTGLQVLEAQRWEEIAPTRDAANVPPGEWNSESEGLTPKQAWWAGYRIGKGLPYDMPRLEAVAAQPPAQAEPAPAPVGEYPALPEPKHRGPSGTGSYFDAYSADQMHTYLDADRSQRPAREVRLLNGGEFEMLAVECFGLSTSAYVKTTLRKFCEVNGLTIKEQS